MYDFGKIDPPSIIMINIYVNSYVILQRNNAQVSSQLEN